MDRLNLKTYMDTGKTTNIAKTTLPEKKVGPYTGELAGEQSEKHMRSHTHSHGLLVSDKVILHT